MKNLQEKTYLARFLDRLMLKEGGTAKDLAARLGIVKSHLSHLLSGKQRSFNYETVAKMVEGVSEDPKVQGEFLKNYLLDQCTDKNRALIHIKVTGAEEISGILMEDAARPPDAIDRFCSHLRHLEVKEETLDVFRRLLDQAENSEALFTALASLADLEISTKRSRGGEWDEFNNEARARTSEEQTAPPAPRKRTRNLEMKVTPESPAFDKP